MRGLGYYSSKYVAPVPYAANGVLFDGTNDRVTKSTDLTGASDGRKALISIWYQLTGDDGVSISFIGGGAATNTAASSLRWAVLRGSDNKIRIQLKDSAGTNVYVWESTATTFTAAAGWHNILTTWDMTNGVETFQIYHDDSSVAGSVAAGPADANIDYTPGACCVGPGYMFFDGDLADVYGNLGEDLDLSVTANRRKFIDASGKPVDLGSDGSLPTGTAPHIFLGDDNDYTNWETNNGGGGNFTEVGALTASSTSPSD